METNNNNSTNPFRKNLSNPINKNKNTMDAGLAQFLEEDEELLAVQRAKQENKNISSFTQNRKDQIAVMIENEANRLNKMYPGGGIKKQRILTYEILEAAPEDYFDKYLKDALFYSDLIRTRIAESDKSEMIAKAQANPTDDAIQDRAFGVVNTLALDLIDNYRGIEKKILLAMIINEILGFSVIDPLWRDKKIDEIICNGPFDIQIEIRGQLYKVPSCQFASVEHLEALLLRLFEGVGKVYSQTSPLIKGRLHDNSRIFATHPVVSPEGPNFNIRKHPDRYWTPSDLIEKNSASQELMEELGNMIYRGASFLIIGGTSTGKAEILSTPIPTPNGWTTIGQIKPNDEVFDHYGNISKVLAIHPQSPKQVYAVEFTNNEIAYVDANHNWYVSSYKSRDQQYNKPPLYSVMTTEEIMQSKLKVNNHFNFRVPVLKKAVNYYDEDTIETLPIHPYLLGLWLGDGNSSEAMLTGLKEDIDEYNLFFNSINLGNIFKTTDSENKQQWKIDYSNMRNKLKDLNILQKNKNKEDGSQKHIPEIYKTASIEARKLLIAGLIDSDGWVDTKKGSWVFTNTNERLVNDYIQVAASLGYIVNKGKKKQKYYTYDKKRKSEKPSWEAKITTSDSLGLLPRKVKQHKKIFKDYISDSILTNGEIAIKNIYKVEGRVEEMVCLTVDSPDNTYMSENSFITTHNTSLLNALTGYYKNDIRIVTIEDNIEMKPNPKKYLAAAMETRPARPDKKEDLGVTIRDLVRASTQMRPDAVIVGETTGPEALDLVNALNTGHFGASTVHANSEEEGLYRLSSLMGQTGEVVGDGALPLIAAAFDFFIYLEHFPIDGSRRIMSISEVAPRPRRDANGNLELPLNQLWRFETEGIDRNGKIVGKYKKVGEFSEERKRRRHLDLTDPLSWDELVELSKIDEESLKKKKNNKFSF